MSSHENSKESWCNLYIINHTKFGYKFSCDNWIQIMITTLTKKHYNTYQIPCYWVLFSTIWSINLFIIHNFKLKNLKFKHSINDIIIDIWFFENFANIKDMRKKFNPIVGLSKLTSNKKILSRVVATNYNLLCNQILSL